MESRSEMKYNCVSKLVCGATLSLGMLTPETFKCGEDSVPLYALSTCTLVGYYTWFSCDTRLPLFPEVGAGSHRTCGGVGLEASLFLVAFVAYVDWSWEMEDLQGNVNQRVRARPSIFP